MCLTPTAPLTKRAYTTDDVFPTLFASSHGGQNQQSILTEAPEEGVYGIMANASWLFPCSEEEGQTWAVNHIGGVVMCQGEAEAIGFKPGVSMRYGGDNRFTDELSPSVDAATGDNRVAVAFAQNVRNEVRLVGGDGQVAAGCAAQTGTHQTTYVCIGEPQEKDLRKGNEKID